VVPYLEALSGAESSHDPSIKNPRSSATGRFQFIDSTWRELMNKYPQLGLTPEGRTSSDQQERAVVAFTRNNARVLSLNGFTPTDMNLRVSHLLGTYGGPRFLLGMATNPNDPAVDHVTGPAAKANREIFYADPETMTQPRTMLEVYQLLGKGFGHETFRETYMMGPIAREAS
jgi:hypothetical protein